MDPVSWRLLTFLLNSTWQVALVAAAAAACAGIANSAPARHRHVLWLMALALGVGLPLLSLHHRHEPLPDALVSGAGASDVTRANAPAPTGSSGIVGVWPAGLLRHRSRGVSIAPATVTALVAAYFVFVACRLVLLWRAWRRTAAIRRTAHRRPLPTGITSAASRCRRAFGIGDVPVLASAHVTGPVTVGARHPVIVLPERLIEAGSPETLASALGHELAHVRRGDFGLNLACELLSLPIAFHPAAALIGRRIRATRELACDEMVAGRLVDRRAYARSLVQIARSMGEPMARAHALGVLDGDALEDRVRRLLERSRPAAGRRGSLSLVLGSTALTLCGLAGSAFSLTPAGPEAKPAALTDGPTAGLERLLEDETEPSGGYAYDARGQRDPFLALAAQPPVPPIEGVAGFGIEEVALRGIVISRSLSTAMILGPDGRAYFIAVGQRFRDGTLIRIESDALMFRQETKDPLRGVQVRAVRVPLHETREVSGSGNR